MSTDTEFLKSPLDKIITHYVKCVRSNIRKLVDMQILR